MDRGTWWAAVHGLAKSQTQTEVTEHFIRQLIELLIALNSSRSM